MLDERALNRAREHEREIQQVERREHSDMVRATGAEIAEIEQLARHVAARLADLDYPDIRIVRRCGGRRWWWFRRRRFDDAGWRIASIPGIYSEPMPIFLLASGEMILGDGRTGANPIEWHPPTIRWSLEKFVSQYDKKRSRRSG